MSFSSTAGVFSQNAFLNPGPAPAPPEQSKLSKTLTSSIDNLNQYPAPPHLPLSQSKRLNDSSKYTHSPSGSDSSFNDINTTTSSNGSPTSISTASSISNNTTIPNQRDDPRGRFVKHGWTVVKEDGSFKMWNKKYLVLRESYLEFYKNEVRIYIIPHFQVSY